MKSSFSRGFFSAAVLLLTALLLVGTTFQALMRDYLSNQVLTDLQADSTAIATLAAGYARQGDLDDLDFAVNLSVIAQTSGADTVICDASGKLVLCSESPVNCTHRGLVIDQRFLSRVMDSEGITSSGLIRGLYEDSRYVSAVPILDTRTNAPVGIVIASTPMEGTLQILQRMSDIYLFVSVFVVAASVLVMTILLRKQSVPLRAVAKTARDFGHGKLDARVQVESGSSEEIQELALAFNNMAASLEKSEYQRQEFVANVSHELKTPMTIISGYVDGILDGTIPPERQRHYMQLVSDETKRLSRLVRSMLDISRLQNGEIPEEKKLRFDICESAGQALITFEQKILAKDLEVDVELPEHPVYTRADPDAITQVLYNLVDNGVKFCPEKGRLGLQVRYDDRKVYVCVSNEGATIPAQELPLVFDRFHKLDKSRSQNRDGWGLGLYIVKTLICSHGEDISVTSRDGVTEFTFTLPLVT